MIHTEPLTTHLLKPKLYIIYFEWEKRTQEKYSKTILRWCLFADFGELGVLIEFVVEISGLIVLRERILTLDINYQIMFEKVVY